MGAAVTHPAAARRRQLEEEEDDLHALVDVHLAHSGALHGTRNPDTQMMGMPIKMESSLIEAG